MFYAKPAMPPVFEGKMTKRGINKKTSWKTRSVPLAIAGTASEPAE